MRKKSQNKIKTNKQTKNTKKKIQTKKIQKKEGKNKQTYQLEQTKMVIKQKKNTNKITYTTFRLHNYFLIFKYLQYIHVQNKAMFSA